MFTPSLIEMNDDDKENLEYLIEEVSNNECIDYQGKMFIKMCLKRSE